MFYKILTLLLAISAVNLLPLDDYVNEPDDNFKYELVKTYDMDEYKIYVINMTSLKWLNESFVESPIWWHWLNIIVPNKIVRPEIGFLWIDGGDNNDIIPTPSDKYISIMSTVALGTGIITAQLQQIPNQPAYFLNDPSRARRVEDALLGWTWKSFINHIDEPEIIALLPMTKASVRAMDVMTDFLNKTLSLSIEEFYVGGESKRGWTTWLTAAVDKRVKAAIPVVMDLMGMTAGFHAHYRSLGGWTFAFQDYWTLNITNMVDSFDLYVMENIVDPMVYFDRFHGMKILAITTSGDEFFLPEDTHTSWTDLVSATDGTVLFRRIPNAEHLLIGHDVSLTFSIQSFLMTVYDKKPLPIVKWWRSVNATHGIIEATVDIENGLVPFDVRVYFAKTLDDKRKDFRLVCADPIDPTKPAPHPVIWEPTKEFLTTNATSTMITYKSTMLQPISGWLGFFIQFSFVSVEYSVIQVTTETHIVPETYPFDDCTLDACFGKLV